MSYLSESKIVPDLPDVGNLYEVLQPKTGSEDEVLERG